MCTNATRATGYIHTQWVNEFERFTPDIPVVLYHGTPQERAHLRESRLSPPRSERSSSAKGKTAAAKKGGKKNNNAKHEEWENTTETFPIVVTS
jgi:ATP-dependent DNA helicase